MTRLVAAMTILLMGASASAFGDDSTWTDRLRIVHERRAILDAMIKEHASRTQELRETRDELSAWHYGWAPDVIDAMDPSVRRDVVADVGAINRTWMVAQVAHAESLFDNIEMLLEEVDGWNRVVFDDAFRAGVRAVLSDAAIANDMALPDMAVYASQFLDVQPILDRVGGDAIEGVCMDLLEEYGRKTREHPGQLTDAISWVAVHRRAEQSRIRSMLDDDAAEAAAREVAARVNEPARILADLHSESVRCVRACAAIVDPADRCALQAHYWPVLFEHLDWSQFVTVREQVDNLANMSDKEDVQAILATWTFAVDQIAADLETTELLYQKTVDLDADEAAAAERLLRIRAQHMHGPSDRGGSGQQRGQLAARRDVLADWKRQLADRLRKVIEMLEGH